MTLRDLVVAARDAALRHGVFDRMSAAGFRYPASAFNLLDALAVAYGTDKSSLYHGYTRWYRPHLGRLRWRRVTLVEIGVGGSNAAYGGGNSLRVWRDYFPRANRIIGIDLHPKDLPRLGERVVVRRADQSQPDELLAALHDVDGIDVVIDDGSHVGSDVWTSFRTLFPLVRSGGWYVVEDLHTSFMASHGGGPDADDGTPLGLVLAAGRWVQRRDAVFGRGLAEAPEVPFDDVAEVHVHPGIAFLRKA